MVLGGKYIDLVVLGLGFLCLWMGVFLVEIGIGCFVELVWKLNVKFERM